MLEVLETPAVSRAEEGRCRGEGFDWGGRRCILRESKVGSRASLAFPAKNGGRETHARTSQQPGESSRLLAALGWANKATIGLAVRLGAALLRIVWPMGDRNTLRRARRL